MKHYLQKTLTFLGQLVPRSIRSRVASSPAGSFVRKFLDGVAADRFPIVRLRGAMAGHQMRINWSLHKVLVFGSYEPHVIKRLTQVVKRGWTVVNAGAHIGYFLMFLAKLVGPSGKVIGFEPLADNYKLLSENLALNRCRNIRAEKLALADQPGRIELRSGTPGALTWVASASLSSELAVESEVVDAVSLDEYARQNNVGRIHFVMLDVEGAERSVLEGMQEILKLERPILLIELHGLDSSGETHPAILFLESMAYRINYLGKRKWEMHVLAEPNGSQAV